MEGFTYFEYPSPERDASIILHFANMECIRVFNRRQLLWKRPQAWLIPGGWHFQIQRIMRPLEVVLLSPFIQGRLEMNTISPLLSTDKLSLQSSVESFVLSQGLGMIRTAVDDLDAEVNQPHTENCKGTSLRPAPRAARSTSSAGSSPTRSGPT